LVLAFLGLKTVALGLRYSLNLHQSYELLLFSRLHPSLDLLA
jgi:hypothetical protein